MADGDDEHPLVRGIRDMLPPGAGTNPYDGRLVVHLFRAAWCDLDRRVLNRACGLLEQVASLELPAALDAVLRGVADRCRASEAYGRVYAGDADITQPVRALWRRYLAFAGDDADGVPGVLALLLLIRVLSGEPQRNVVGELDGHPLRPSVLYIAASRRLETAVGGDVRQLVRAALDALHDAGHVPSGRRLRARAEAGGVGA